MPLGTGADRLLGEKLSFCLRVWHGYFGPDAADQSFLGIEGGGTRTVALASDSFAPDAHPLWRGVFGPGNVRLLSDSGLVDLFTQIAATVSAPRAIGVGMAGARDSVDRKRISDAMDRIWPGVPRVITHDLKIATGNLPQVRYEAGPERHWVLLLRLKKLQKRSEVRRLGSSAGRCVQRL